MACVQPQMHPSKRVFVEGLLGSVHRTKENCEVGNYEFPEAGTQVELHCLNMITGLGTENT